MATRVSQTSFADSLIAQNIVTDEQLAATLKLGAARGTRLAATLSRLGMASDQDIADAYRAATALPLARRDALTLPPALADRINPAWLARNAILPTALSDEALDVVMADPEDREALDALLFATGSYSAAISIATFGDIDEALAEVGTASSPATATP